ncbi:Uncharacterized protein Rs2_45079 [Raphanus sativus]|nr:Uncharacterized protein Rs2_45079 [Raphanus sativus]
MGLTIFFAILMSFCEHRAKLKRNKMTASNRLTVAWIFNSRHQYRLPYHPHRLQCLPSSRTDSSTTTRSTTYHWYSSTSDSVYWNHQLSISICRSSNSFSLSPFSQVERTILYSCEKI